mgnify:CR=1 FL=1
MRIYKTLAILALTLVPVAASAQTNSELKGKGFIDFGVRGTSTTGEPSRYERFRDLQDGFFLENFRYDTTINGWRVNLGADKVAEKLPPLVRAVTYTGYTPLDPSQPVAFDGATVKWNGKVFTLDANTVFLDETVRS